MSASREKKQRQTGEGDLTPRQRRELDEAKKAKRNKILYTILTVVIVALVAALLLWNSGLLRGNPVAATVNGKEYHASQLSYYYGNIRQQAVQTASIYQQLGMAGGYNTAIPASEQIQDEASGKTYAQFFEEEALGQLKEVILLNDQAGAEGYVLSDEGKGYVQNGVRNFELDAARNGFSYDGYLKAVFGPYMNKKDFEAELTRAMLADEYKIHKTESFSYTDSELDAHYKNNAGAMDTYEYYYAQIDGAPSAKTDAEGNPVESTDAEKAAAMSQAKLKAEAMSADLKSGADFNATAQKYVSDEEKENYQSDSTYRYQKDDLGSNLTSSSYGQWLTSSETPRKAGDIGVVEDTAGSCYYVVQLVNRWRAEDTYYSIDARHILIKAEISEGADSPTDEQYAAARAQVEALKAQWESGAKTADSFGELATANSADEGSKQDGGLIKKITKGQTVAEFDEFLFTPGRQVGDVGVAKNTGSGMQGYHLVYIDALGDLAWKGTALNSLRTAAYGEWYKGVDAGYTAEAVPEGMSALSK